MDVQHRALQTPFIPIIASEDLVRKDTFREDEEQAPCLFWYPEQMHVSWEQSCIPGARCREIEFVPKMTMYTCGEAGCAVI